MNSTKIAEYKDLLSYIPDNWTLGKYIDFPQFIYMEFDNNKIPALQVTPQVFDNYSLESGEKLLDYIYLIHKNFSPLIEENEKLNQEIKKRDFELAQLRTEKNTIKKILRSIKEEYLRISGSIITKFLFNEKFRKLLESL